MFCRQIFRNISGGFRGISRFGGNFAEKPEFRGSATARNIRSPADSSIFLPEQLHLKWLILHQKRNTMYYVLDSLPFFTVSFPLLSEFVGRGGQAYADIFSGINWSDPSSFGYGALPFVLRHSAIN